MDPRDLFRGFFGFSGRLDNRKNEEEEDPRGEGTSRTHHHDSNVAPPGLNFHVDVFTNPLAMHQWFDQQMDQVLKSFGIGQGFGGFAGPSRDDGDHWEPQDPSRRGLQQLPFDDDDPSADESSAGSRDFMLKDGFGFSPAGDGKEDKDLDSENVDRLFESRSSVVPVVPSTPSWLTPFFETPREHQQQPGSSSSSHFYFSSTQKTVSLPDGSVEHHSTKRSSDGNETTTVRRTTADGKSHTVTTVRNPDGREERTETVQEGGGRRGPLAGDYDSGDNHVSRREGTITKALFEKFFGSS